MKKKSPAFQFYPNDWLSSPRIMLMTPAEEGAYIRLLCICWMKGHLPDDDNELSTLSRLGEGWFNGSGDKIKKCFQKRKRKLYHERLSKERGKQRKWSQKSREGGKKSGKSRKDKALQGERGVKGGSQIVDVLDEPNANQTPTLQSSSSSSDFKYTYTEQQFSDLNIQAGLTVDECIACFHYYNKKGFVDKDGNKITDPLSALINWRINRPRFDRTKGNINGNNSENSAGSAQPFIR